jgi:hypothetical protein
MESIMFVLKKLFGEHITTISTSSQRQQMRFRIIAYNAYRKASRKLGLLLMSISTQPQKTPFKVTMHVERPKNL